MEARNRDYPPLGRAVSHTPAPSWLCDTSSYPTVNDGFLANVSNNPHKSFCEIAVLLTLRYAPVRGKSLLSSANEACDKRSLWSDTELKEVHGGGVPAGRSKAQAPLLRRLNAGETEPVRTSTRDASVA